MNFYAVIIGTEILNGRREDKHFAFLRDELAKYGQELLASFIIKDDEKLMTNCYELIKNDEKAVLFSFGGIGSTPDDLTREIAAKVFTSKPLFRHKMFEKDITEKFADAAYPHRIHMSDLPQNSNLLFNPINNMSGFSLENKYFFVPGFPQMAHPMISEVIKTYFSKSVKRFRYTLLAKTSENTLVSVMEKLPPQVELSSLPIFVDSKASVELSLIGTDENEVKSCFELFTKELKRLKIEYRLI
ncbi:MAG: molybdopterin-binding protein [Helicobacteraceae bacterium CG2_30_36_10]|nr:MAG: molybdopterin-binding protein [Helicobacteraceae bacterium CG2_30_36_10]